VSPPEKIEQVEREVEKIEQEPEKADKPEREFIEIDSLKKKIT